MVAVRSGRFKRDIRRREKRNRDMTKLRQVLLLEQQNLPADYRDHPLRGDWRGFRDLRIEPDWLLIYRVENDELQLARTGGHADLFTE
ncbi:type II toxin-antitoxin system YafQ family toxin [Rhizobium sp. 2YAF20]|uniref:type II toxin-antitoxin system YafQ family toxin n=1 Tax=Rhizobium sp. 2YAF20 TaxID=3233027 RepID=UPI003F9D6578